ncbi:MAG: tetratricopeptide repeat protein [Parvularculaceae bacterium]
MTFATQSRLNDAVALLQKGDAVGAAAVARSVLGANSGDIEARHLLALALSALGETGEAAAAFEAVAAVHPRKDVILVNLGNHWRRAGRLDAAVDAYERAVGAAPESAQALAALGAARASQGQQGQAADAFTAALTRNPRQVTALIGLGNLQAAKGRHASAAEFFTRAIDVEPQSAAALVNRGASLRQLGRLDEALADHDRALSLAPSLAEAAFQRAATLRLCGRFDVAAAGYRSALALAPARTDIHREYAGLMFETARASEAFGVLDAVIARQPSATLLTTRGELSLLAGDRGAAAASARRALALDPEHAAAFGLAAKAARLAASMEEALTLARRSVDLAPDDFDLLHLCCEIELATGEFTHAAARLGRDAPGRHLQKHIALKAIALRAAGDPGYRRYYDYDRLTAQIAIDPPDGFSTIEDFNATLFAAIAPLHRSSQRPLDQTLFGGTQSPGRLWNDPNPIIQLFAKTMLASARAFIASLPDDPTHPFLGRKRADVECAGAWSVMLASGGGHVDHIHPAGWISASYYVETPPEILGGGTGGYLRLGASGVAGLPLPAERYFAPRPGTVVFFPSYIWHGVEPFNAASARVAAPFDLKPAE